MNDQATITCARCGRADVTPVRPPPFPTDLGRRVAAEICMDCWDEWKRRQMLLINHYGLNLQDDRARAFLFRNLESFLFGEGEEAEIDTSKEGTLKW